jgi:hypothetical protein
MRVKPNVSPSVDKIQENTPMSVKHSSYETREEGQLLRIYSPRQITHRAIATNKRDHVIATIHASKLKTKQNKNRTYKNYN